MTMDGGSAGETTVLRKEGFTLSCAVDANPAIASDSIVWRRAGGLVAGATTAQLVEASGLEASTEYECQASNEEGAGRGQLQVQVHCKCGQGVSLVWQQRSR